MNYRDGVPCKHPGCLSHVSHPCEGCGRIGGQSDELNNRREAWKEFREQTAHAYSDATTPGFFRAPDPPAFPDPDDYDPNWRKVE